jgi:hypothetical protein
VDAFFAGLIERLQTAGFHLESPGEIGRTPLALEASRPGSLTDSAMYLYAARAELLEGGSAGRPLSPVATALFVQAAATAPRPSGGLVGALLGHQAVVAPVLVTAAGCERRTVGHLLATIREPTNVIVLPAIVDLGTGTVEVVGSRSLLPGDPTSVRARLHALLAWHEPAPGPSW